jgi:hypothetical protein
MEKFIIMKSVPKRALSYFKERFLTFSNFWFYTCFTLFKTLVSHLFHTFKIRNYDKCTTRGLSLSRAQSHFFTIFRVVSFFLHTLIHRPYMLGLHIIVTYRVRQATKSGKQVRHVEGTSRAESSNEASFDESGANLPLAGPNMTRSLSS